MTRNIAPGILGLDVQNIPTPLTKFMMTAPNFASGIRICHH